MPLNVCMNFKLPSLFSYLPAHKLLWFFFSSVQAVPSWINIYLVPDHTKEQWRATTTQIHINSNSSTDEEWGLVARLCGCLKRFLCISPIYYVSTDICPSPGCVCTFCSKYAAGAAVLQCCRPGQWRPLQQRPDPPRQLGGPSPAASFGLWMICRYIDIVYLWKGVVESWVKYSD